MAFKIESNPEKSLNQLEVLFKKTKTKPFIYYLPLTEQQVLTFLNKRWKKKNKKIDIC